MTQHLTLWGCPLRLLEGLDSETTGSRQLLLLLGWLVDYSRLFQSAISMLQPSEDIANLLPPYPVVRATLQLAVSPYALKPYPPLAYSRPLTSLGFSSESKAPPPLPYKP